MIQLRWYKDKLQYRQKIDTTIRAGGPMTFPSAPVNLEWSPWIDVPTVDDFQEGARVRVNQTAGFHRGATGVIEFIEPNPDGKVWVLRDRSSSPVYYQRDELEIIE